MAKAFREGNEVRWRGIRLAHKGTQVTAYVQAAGGTAIAYTVPAGQTLFISHYTVSCRGAAAGQAAMVIYTAVPAVSSYHGVIEHDPNTTGTLGLGLFDPIEVPAGYTVRAYSSAAGVVCQITIAGWVE